MGSTCILSVLSSQPARNKNPGKFMEIIRASFRVYTFCARQFLWVSAGEKIGILPSRRLQSVTSSWVWFEWTTYRFSVGLTHTPAAHFPHHACVLIPEWTQLGAWKRASRHKRWMTLSLGGFFKERFHLERFSTWPTELDCMSLSLSSTLVQVAFYSMAE